MDIASAAAVASSSSDALATGKPVKITYHRLKIQQALQPALRNLGLVRRVLRVQPGFQKHFAK